MPNETTQRSFFIICWENLLQLMGLNCCFIICCIPIITIPAAATGLSRACQCCLMEKGHLFREFFRSFRKTLVHAVPIGLLFFAVLFGLFYGIIFYAANSGENIVFLACAIFCMIAFYLAFCTAMFTFHLFAAVEIKALSAVREAVGLMLQSPRLLFTWMALGFGVLAVTIWFFPYTFPVMILLSFSLSAMMTARGVFPLLSEKSKG